MVNDMEYLYEIKGLEVLGDRVRLKINPVKKKEKLDPMGALGDLGGFMSNLKLEAHISNNPDIISIPIDEWKNCRVNIGEVLTIQIKIGR